MNRSNMSEWEYSFTWHILDFTFCNKKTGEALNSPTFSVSALRDTKWHLSICPGGYNEDSNEYISCFLDKNMDNEFEEESLIDCQIRMILNGKLLETKIGNKYVVKNGSKVGYFNFFKREDLLVEMKNCNSNTLTLQCHINSQNKIKQPNEKNEARTMILTDKSCFTWNIKMIEKFSAESTNIRYFCLKNIFYKLTLRILKEDVIIIIQKICEGSSTSCEIVGKISVLDLKGNESLTKQDKHIFCSNQTWEFRAFLTKKQLLENVKAGVVALICEFFTLESLESNTASDPVAFSDADSFSNLSIDFQNMFTTKMCFDVKLRVNDAEEFQAHRCVLAARSPVFCAMFDQDMIENRTGVIDIEDVDASTLESFLKFLYTGTVEDMDSEIAIKLLMVADKYDVPFLKQKCAFFLMTSLTVDNVCEILSLVDMVQIEDLKAHALNFAIQHAPEVFSSPELSNWIRAHPDLSAEIMAYFAKGYPQLDQMRATPQCSTTSQMSADAQPDPDAAFQALQSEHPAFATSQNALMRASMTAPPVSGTSVVTMSPAEFNDALLRYNMSNRGHMVSPNSSAFFVPNIPQGQGEFAKSMANLPTN